MQGPLTELLANPGLVRRMTARDFKARYAGSLMGVFWTVLTPLVLLAIFTFIFTVVFRQRFGNRPELSVSALYILAGLLPWLAFQEGVARAATVVLENKNLITRARFPRSVISSFPALSALLGQLAGIIILTVLAAVMVRTPGPSLLLLPLLLVVQALFTIGIALALAALAVHLRDLVHLVPPLLLVWFYATPVFYPASLVPEKFQIIVDLNPMAHFISAYRSIILEAAWPSPGPLAALAGSTALALLIGAVIHRRLAPSFADKL